MSLVSKWLAVWGKQLKNHASGLILAHPMVYKELKESLPEYEGLFEWSEGVDPHNPLVYEDADTYYGAKRRLQAEKQTLLGDNGWTYHVIDNGTDSLWAHKCGNTVHYKEEAEKQARKYGPLCNICRDPQRRKNG